MLVIDSLMILYAKEVATGDRIATTIARLSGGSIQRDKFNYETGLLCWISHTCAALKRRIDLDIEHNTESDVSSTPLLYLDSRWIIYCVLFFCVYIVYPPAITKHPTDP